MGSTLSNPKLIASLSAGIIPQNSAFNIVPMTTAVPYALGVGSTSGNVDGVYAQDRTVTAGSPDKINLMAITDPTGATLAVARLVAIQIVNNSNISGQTITLGGSVTPYIGSPQQPIGPQGGSLLYSPLDGISPVSSAAGNLFVTASSSVVPYSIRLYTRSA